ncbi:hypothetical protein LguiB_020405 [Lonicera macranthoides]
MPGNLYNDLRISSPRGRLPPRHPSPSTPPSEMDNEDNESNAGENNDHNRPVRTVRDYLQPPRGTSNSCIIIPVGQAGTFTLKPGMLQHIPSFRGHVSTLVLLVRR